MNRLFGHDKYKKMVDRNLMQPQSLEEICKDKIANSRVDKDARRKSKRLLRNVVRGAGLRFETHNVDALEIFGYICRGKDEICSVIKAWNDPVITLQDEIMISRLGGDFKKRFLEIHEICALKYVTMLFPPVKSFPEFEVVLHMGLCEYGFNEDTLKWALGTFQKCLEKIKPFLESR